MKRNLIDTNKTCIPDRQLRLALQAVEQGRQCEHEVVLLNNKVDYLYNRLSIKDSVINEYKSVNIINKSIIQSHEKTEDNLNQQISYLKKDISFYKGQVTKLKVLGIGVVVVVTALLILFK